MPDFTDKELLQIIADSEADRVEFEESLSGSAPTRIREAICAFANDKGSVKILRGDENVCSSFNVLQQ